MEKNDILESLEKGKNRIEMSKSTGLEGSSDTIAITTIIEALIYIIRKLDGETIIVEPVAAVKDPPKLKKTESHKTDQKIRKVDYGKIVALHKAGWTQKKIGEEMGVSATAISTALKRYKYKIECGYIWNAEEREFIKKR